MAKGTPQIIGSVRIGNDVYRKGDEEALAKVADKSMIKRLTDKGVISGGESPAEEAAATQTEEKK